MTLAASRAMFADPLTLRAVELFVALSMCVFAIQKLRDLEAVSDQFVDYDLLAQRGCLTRTSTPSRRPTSGSG